MGIEYVDGRRYGRAVVAGADWVLHTREHLDRLNVFPVPDGDTGTNMALSLAAAAAAARAAGEERDLATVAARVAEAGILGARGNSGLLLAHWFLGISRAIGTAGRIDAAGLASALEHAARDVYDAVTDPVEGTILTVMRSAAGRARESASGGRNVEAMLDDVIDAAEDSLARTPDLLPVLKEAQVVDAGAAGWVHFMKGVRRAIRGEGPPDYTQEELRERTTLGDGSHVVDVDGDRSQRYCTELICRGEDFDAERLRRLFARHGTYVLVATTGTVFKLHIHTNRPEEVFRRAEKLGSLEERKVDDMWRQHRDSEMTPADLGAQPSTVAILTDSTADLTPAVRERHGIATVPLQVLFGNEAFEDQVDLDTAEFYARLARGERPTTSQPPPRAFVDALERVRADRDVVILTISARLSGTFASARSAARLAPHGRVVVVDSRSASVGLGLMARNAARLAERGAAVDEIVSAVELWRVRTSITFSVASLEYLRRGGRISAARTLLGNLLGVRPVLHFAGESVEAVARARGDRDAFAQVMAQVARDAPRGSRIRAGLIAATDSGSVLDEVEDALRAGWDVAEVLRGGITGVIGAHTGPGTWAVVVQRVEGDDPLESR